VLARQHWGELAVAPYSHRADLWDRLQLTANALCDGDAVVWVGLLIPIQHSHPFQIVKLTLAS